jgi:hypothetical protein
MVNPISPTPRIPARMPSMEPIYNLHKAELKLIDEIRKRRHGCIQVEFQDGVPLVIVTVRKEDKLKLA